MKKDLASYLKMAAAEPFIWGETDCCIFLAGWILWKHGVDLASGFLGHYHSRRGAQRLLNLEGGLLALLDKRLPPAGFPRAEAPEAGDAGVIIGSLGETASIRTEIGWICKAESGLIVGPFPAVAVWKL